MTPRRWLLHPFLFATYFVLTLAASNTTELKAPGLGIVVFSGYRKQVS
jgi:hypothetical protein